MEVLSRDTAARGVLLTSLLLLLLLQQARGDGEVSIKFIKYTNPGGKGSNGHCCDGRGVWCRSHCDHYFTICLDVQGSDFDDDSCLYGQYVSGKLKNKNNNVFRDSIGDLPNPFSFTVPGPIDVMTRLKVRVMDADSGLGGYDDHVDDLSTDLYVHKGPYASISMPIKINARTELRLEATVRCAADWYDEDCSVLCRPRAQDNYYCDGWTGQKICHPGWRGENCDLEGNF